LYKNSFLLLLQLGGFINNATYPVHPSKYPAP
jgi:hypothetical protein